MLKLGVIEPSHSPYSTLVVLVRKRDGTNRFCIDFCKLNKVVLFDPEPLPSAENPMVKVAEGRIFTKLDLSKGFWQIPIPTEERCKTAFNSNS